MKNLILTYCPVAVLAAILALGANATQAYADSGPYGGEGEERVTVSKTVRRSGVGDFVDTVTGLTAKEVVEFRIEVTNTGSAVLENVDVRDYLPAELELIGSVSSWVIDRLDPGEGVTITFQARVRAVAGVNEQICVVNVVEALGEADSATVCVSGPPAGGAATKGGQVLATATQLPEAGPGNDPALAYSILGLGLGTLLRKLRIK